MGFTFTFDSLKSATNQPWRAHHSQIYFDMDRGIDLFLALLYALIYPIYTGIENYANLNNL